jgi:hypothetical protein
VGNFFLLPAGCNYMISLCSRLGSSRLRIWFRKKWGFESPFPHNIEITPENGVWCLRRRLSEFGVGTMWVLLAGWAASSWTNWQASLRSQPNNGVRLPSFDLCPRRSCAGASDDHTRGSVRADSANGDGSCRASVKAA